jgi:hypothetical protein
VGGASALAERLLDPGPLAVDLLAAGAEIVAYDPEAHHTARQILGDRVTYAASALDALASSAVDSPSAEGPLGVPLPGASGETVSSVRL